MVRDLEADMPSNHESHWYFIFFTWFGGILAFKLRKSYLDLRSLKSGNKYVWKFNSNNIHKSTVIPVTARAEIVLFASFSEELLKIRVVRP